MSEIDLIPSSYRKYLKQLHLLKMFVLITCSLLLVTGVAYGSLEYASRETVTQIKELTMLKAITSQQREELALLRQKKSEYEYRWTLLNGLRKGAAVEDMFITIDHALVDSDVWFSSLKFERADVAVSSEQKTVNTGYFVIVSPSPEQGEQDAWAIETKMRISGQARDHSALSLFVKYLLDQPKVLDVRVLKTALRRHTKSSVIDFDLAIAVMPEHESS